MFRFYFLISQVSECYRGRGESYNGVVSETVSGNTCINWGTIAEFNRLVDV